MKRIDWVKIRYWFRTAKPKDIKMPDWFASILLITVFVVSCLATGIFAGTKIAQFENLNAAGDQGVIIIFIISLLPSVFVGFGMVYLVNCMLSAYVAVDKAIKSINKTHRLPGPLKTLWFAILLFPGVIGHLPHLVWWLAKMIFSPRRWARMAAKIAGAIRGWQQNRRDPRLRALAAQENKLRKEFKAIRRGADGELTARIERNLSQIRELRRQILAEAESERQARIRLHHEAKIEAAEAVIDEIRQLIEAETMERLEDGERLAVAYDEAEQAANGKALEELFQDR